MTNIDNLPALPVPAMPSSIHAKRLDRHYFSADQMRAYAREAIRAALAAGGEPVLCVAKNDLKKLKAGDDSIRAWLPPIMGDTELALYTRPQPDQSARVAELGAKLRCSLSWGGFNVYGDEKSIRETGAMLHSHGIVHELQATIRNLNAQLATAEQRVAERMRAAAVEACNANAASYRKMADSTLMTENGRTLHEGMLGGAENCAYAIAALPTSPAPAAAEPCLTCNGHGMVGGPSYYQPDEGGVPCPDCNSPAADKKRCEYCDDTGDVHTPTGEWRGRCHCQAADAEGGEA